MDQITENNLVRKSKNVFFNRLVLVAPKNSFLKLAESDLNNISLYLNGGRLAVAEVSAVPAGIYAKQALENLKISFGDLSPDGTYQYARLNDDLNIYALNTSFGNALKFLIESPPFPDWVYTFDKENINKNKN